MLSIFQGNVAYGTERFLQRTENSAGLQATPSFIPPIPGSLLPFFHYFLVSSLTNVSVSSSALRLSSLVSAAGALIHSVLSFSSFLFSAFSLFSAFLSVSRAPSPPSLPSDPSHLFSVSLVSVLFSALHTTPVFRVPRLPVSPLSFLVFLSFVPLHCVFFFFFFSRTHRHEHPAKIHRDFNTFNFFVIRFASTATPRRVRCSIRTSSPSSRPSVSSGRRCPEERNLTDDAFVAYPAQVPRSFHDCNFAIRVYREEVKRKIRRVVRDTRGRRWFCNSGREAESRVSRCVLAQSTENAFVGSLR